MKAVRDAYERMQEGSSEDEGGDKDWVPDEEEEEEGKPCSSKSVSRKRRSDGGRGRLWGKNHTDFILPSENYKRLVIWLRVEYLEFWA